MSNISNLGNFPHTIGNLDDRPNLPAAQMKAKFEADVMTLWAKLAEAIPDINSALPASKLVDVVNSSSTDNGVPTAKAVYDAIVDASLGGSAQQIIDDWLDAHPEATTTVTDGSITNAKLATSFVTPGSAPAYVANTFYQAGSYVFKDGVLYTNDEDVDDAVWTAGHWRVAMIGDDVSAIKQESRNLWPFDSSKTFTTAKHYSSNDVVLPAGTYSVSAIISSGAGINRCMMRFDDYSQNQIATVTVAVGQTRNSNTITLSEDCYGIWLYAGPYSSASTGVTATWKYIQIDAGIFSTDYVPHLSAKDTVLETAVYLKTELSPTFVSNKYINYTNGEEVGLNGAVATSFVPVNPGSYLLIDAVFVDNAGAAFYTNSKIYLSGLSSDWPIYDTGSRRKVLVPEYASYIRVSSLDYVPRIWVMKDKETLYEMIAGNNGKTCASASLFASMGVCGDSYTAAQFWKNDVLLGDNEQISWGKILGRKNGINVSVYASSGANTNLWLTRESCLPKLLNESPKDLYIISLGINDQSTITLGTISDIHTDYTLNPNTYYGNMGRIIDQIAAHAPKAKIILAKCWLVNEVYYSYCADAIDEIAQHYSIAVVDTADSKYFSSSSFVNGLSHGHPTPVQQSKMAEEMYSLVSKSMDDYIEYFNDYFPDSNES